MKKSIKLKKWLIALAAIIAMQLPITAKADVPDDAKRCAPTVTDFTVAPQRLTSRDSAITYTVTVETVGCIIDGGTKWKVVAEFVDDDGQYYANGAGYQLPETGFIRPSDFRNIPGSQTRVRATYTDTASDTFRGETGNTITLRPNLFWDYEGPDNTRYVTNTSLQKIVSATGGSVPTNNPPTNTGNNPPNNVPPPNTNVGINSNVDYDLGPAFENPLDANSVPELITRIIKLLLLLIGMAAVIMIIIGGFRMIINGGNPAELAKAKSTVIWAIIGLVVALMSFSIVAIVQRLIQT